MKIIKKIAEKNPRVDAGKVCKKTGIVLHSVGCSQPEAEVFANSWNRTTTKAEAHFVLQADGTVYQIAPANYRLWHVGGSGNTSHIGIEMCEPDCIKYTSGSKFTCSDKSKAMEYVQNCYNTAVELVAKLCKEHGISVDNVVSHSEAHDKGIGSNHADPEHLWKGLGLKYTMSGFRNDVREALNAPKAEKTDKDFKIKVNTSILRIRRSPSLSGLIYGYCPKGTYTIVETKFADGYEWGKLKSGAGWIALDYVDRL